MVTMRGVWCIMAVSCTVLLSVTTAGTYLWQGALTWLIPACKGCACLNLHGKGAGRESTDLVSRNPSKTKISFVQRLAATPGNTHPKHTDNALCGKGAIRKMALGQ